MLGLGSRSAPVQFRFGHDEPTVSDGFTGLKVSDRFTRLPIGTDQKRVAFRKV